MPSGAALVLKATGSEFPSATQLTVEAVFTSTLSSETLTLNFGSVVYTVST